MPYGKTLDIEMVYLRATLVLCYGYIVYYCPPEMVVQRLEQTVLPFLRQYIASCKVEDEHVFQNRQFCFKRFIGYGHQGGTLGNDQPNSANRSSVPLEQRLQI